MFHRGILSQGRNMHGRILFHNPHAMVEIYMPWSCLQSMPAFISGKIVMYIRPIHGGNINPTWMPLHGMDFRMRKVYIWYVYIPIKVY